MADPEQIYSEVLSEEQGKGVSAPVAEGRAKAARARAEAGSPHPKEPKWWPGSQPHLEGGGGDGAAPADEPVEEAAQDEPAEAPVAEETPAATEEAQAPQVPQEQTAPPEPAQPAAAAESAEPAATAPAAAPEAPAAAKPAGVTHGTATGTRLRPEDAATTDAQFQGQMDMYARRKLIDELVGTGVPVVSAADTGDKRSPALALLYLLIPIMAIAFLLANNESTPAAPEGGGGGESGAVTLTAANVQFDTDQLSWPAGEETAVEFHNEDTAPHNLAIYTDDSASEDLFAGQIIDGGGSTTYQIDPLEAGEYYFQCDVHPSMNGTLTVE